MQNSGSEFSGKRVASDDVEVGYEEKRRRTEGDNEMQKEAKVDRVRRDKYAMFLSYCGSGYFGMQINGDIPTIEREILNALFKCDLIDDEDARRPGGKLMFQRAARTDKNVSAVKQICSLKLPRHVHDALNSSVNNKLNGFLPENIKIWGFVKSTQGFNSKTNCDNRTYSYTLPSFALAPNHQITDTAYRISAEQIKHVDDLLHKFRGTKNFYNFTFGREPTDRSLFRYIISFSCGDPFTIDSTEFLTVRIRGQSFMIHQIRKMIGLTIAVTRGLADASIIDKALDNKNKVDVPKAPGTGLVLEEVHYDAYNKKFEKTHSKINWDPFEDEVSSFRRDRILQNIVGTEAKDNEMVEWLKVLDLHTFSVDNGKSTVSTPKPTAVQTVDTGDASKS